MNPASPTPKTLGPLRVLMIEDNGPDAELCLRELKKGGFEPQAETVQTQHEFISRLAAGSYDVVLTDCTLPAWNGAEAVDLIQQMEQDIPCIVITGTRREEEARELIGRGAADFVHKNHLWRLPLVMQQVLERRRLQAECARLDSRWRDAEARCQRLAELCPEPLFIETEDRVAFANSAAIKLFGANTSADLVDQGIRNLVDPDCFRQCVDQLQKLEGSTAQVSFETRLRRLDGKSIDVRVAATALRYDDKPAVQWIAHDVSERRHVEQAVRSLAAFPQLDPNPVLEFARDGQLTYFNEAAADVAKSLGVEHPSGILPPETSAIVRTCLATGQKKTGLETTLGGRTFSWAFFPVNANQIVHCHVADITERQKLEAQLRHSQRLESVGRLAAGVAHDFKNILTVIQGYTGLLRADPALSPAMQESLQHVLRATERASKLTSQLLLFSRKSSMQFRRVDVNEIATNLSTILQRTLGEDISFQFSYADNLPPVHADAGMLEQVIMNLAVNARDAMPRGGQLVISTSFVDVDRAYVQRFPTEARTGRFVCLTIIDTGCGMDTVTSSRIFEPFFTTKEFGKGTGLGLATCYGIVKQHGGWFEVNSRLGQGTTFKVFLPPTDRPPERATEKPPEPLSRGNETILVVEDEQPVRWTLKQILEKAGYRILEAANGVEALAVWHQHHQQIGLLLTDVVMPVGLSGQELAAQFRAQRPTLRVLFTSGYSPQSAGGREMVSLEDASFLQKPFDARKLTVAVRECLDI